MSLSCYDFPEAQDLLKDFIEVKSPQQNRNNLEGRDSFKQLNYWKLILYSIAIGTVANAVMRAKALRREPPL